MKNDQVVWPRPTADSIVLYLLGSGYGESQIVLFPDGRTMVVDSCNLTVSCLKKLGIAKIDLLVLTHSDEDHLTGMPELLRGFALGEVWVYPHLVHSKNYVAWANRANQDPERGKILTELAETFAEIDALRMEHDSVATVQWNTTPWPEDGNEFKVHPIAPADEDTTQFARFFAKLLERNAEGRFEVTPFGQKALNNEKKGDPPNRLSIALSIEWKGRRLLLSGDVEKGGGKNGQAGWDGVLSKLNKRNRLRLVTDVDVVKVAHHGSEGAFHDVAWKRHCTRDARGSSTLALIAPNSGHKLPHTATLQALRAYATELGVTSNAGGGVDRALSAGWTNSSRQVGSLDDVNTVLAVVLHADGTTEVHAGTGSAFLNA